MTTHEQLANTEARHAHRDLLAEKDAEIERLTNERDESVNQLDSALHSVDVLEKRVGEKLAEIERLTALLEEAVSQLEEGHKWAADHEAEPDHEAVRGWVEVHNRNTLSRISAKEPING